MKALTEQDPQAELRRLGGGKALNLHMLAGSGWRVPAWAVIGGDVFERFADDTGLEEEVARVFAEDDADRRGLLRARIAAAPVGHAVFEVIAEAYERAGAKAVAVRSSGTEEDAAANSFAGQFDSFLNVRGLEQVVSHVKLCWASTFGERAATYRRERGLSGSAAGMAVIVQTQVRGEKSGVTFTANPASCSREELVLSATFGLGPSLVDGSVDADTLILDRATGECRHTHVGEKHARLDMAPDAEGCVRVELSDDERAGLSLSDDEIAELWRAGVEIEERFGSPQDIEWTLAEGKLWLLQSRPITSLGSAVEGKGDEPPQGQLRVWDNSNIVESFGDVTSPLTFTFTQHLYHQVHRWYCKSLKVPEYLLRDMDEWQSNRLAYFNGRVYYNLLNWYRMQHLLPFPGMKRQMMELAMGVDESVSAEMAEAARPLRHRTRATERWLRLVTSTVFAWRFFTSGRDVRRFLKRFDRDFKELDKLDFDAMSAEELYSQVLMLDRELLPTWGPIVALEGIILTALGLLFGLTRRWLPDAPRWFYWNVGKPKDGVESAAPARAMTELADAALADSEVESIVREGQPGTAYERLAAAGKSDFLAAVDRYIERYGYRSVDDLKLEEPSMRDDVSVLFVLLRGALARPERQAHGGAPASGHGEEERDPDAYLDAHMGRWRRRVYELLRRKAQAGLAAREQVRFCRSRGFGLVRRMAWAVDRKLVQEGMLEQPGDVFQLRLEELRGAFEGTISHDELKPLIALRKRQREAHAELSPPPRFITRGPMYWHGNLERAGWYDAVKTAGPAAESAGSGHLQGVGCCPGRVVGEAKVLDAPIETDGEVLVAYRTDPGWIAALPSVSALLVERGSPLTHVAVVARELGVPTVVQIKNLTTAVQTGMTVDVDGGAGTVTIVPEGSR